MPAVMCNVGKSNAILWFWQSKVACGLEEGTVAAAEYELVKAASVSDAFIRRPIGDGDRRVALHALSCACFEISVNFCALYISFVNCATQDPHNHLSSVSPLRGAAVSKSAASAAVVGAIGHLRTADKCVTKGARDRQSDNASGQHQPCIMCEHGGQDPPTAAHIRRAAVAPFTIHAHISLTSLTITVTVYILSKPPLSLTDHAPGAWPAQ
jgi:hypothetical protein